MISREKKRLMNIRKVSDCVRHSFKNVIKCSHGKSESIGHKQMKCDIAMFCYEHDLTFGTEVEFNNGGRADFVIYDWACCFEVLKSETDKQFQKKDYPIPIIKVKTYSPTIILMLTELYATQGEGVEYYAE
jgi:hypothetical protein